MATGRTSTNFAFLAAHDALLDHLAALAERYFVDDPATCLDAIRAAAEWARENLGLEFSRLRGDGPV